MLFHIAETIRFGSTLPGGRVVREIQDLPVARIISESLAQVPRKRRWCVAVN